MITEHPIDYSSAIIEYKSRSQTSPRLAKLPPQHVQLFHHLLGVPVPAGWLLVLVHHPTLGALCHPRSTGRADEVTLQAAVDVTWL